MIFINPLLQTVCFVMAVLHEVCVPMHIWTTINSLLYHNAWCSGVGLYKDFSELYQEYP